MNGKPGRSILSNRSPETPRREPMKLLALLFLLGAGCASRGGADIIEIEIENRTPRYVTAILETGLPFFSPALRLAPGEVRTVTVPRAYLPGRTRLLIID